MLNVNLRISIVLLLCDCMLQGMDSLVGGIIWFQDRLGNNGIQLALIPRN